MDWIEVTVAVPEDRLAEFYRLVGQWLEPGAAAAESAPRRVSRSSRYAPLYTYLSEELEPGGDSVSLGFDEIEKIIDGELPESARRHRAWWANTDSHAQAQAWLSAGWKIDAVDLEENRIHLVRRG